MSVNGVTRLVDLLLSASDRGYIDEPVSQLEHALQAAYFAEKSGAVNEVILAALLHDIGHFCEEVKSRQMGDLGTEDHEAIGAGYLIQAGFSEKTATLVACHVEAKRFLAGINQEYLRKLSTASRGTLDYQGGPMSKHEQEAFRQSRWFREKLQVRVADEKAKVLDLEVPDISRYTARLYADIVGSGLDSPAAKKAAIDRILSQDLSRPSQKVPPR